MRCRKKLSKTRRRIRRAILTILSLAIILVVFFETSVRTQLATVIIRETDTLIETVVTAAVGDFLAENESFADHLIELRCGPSGEICAITTNAFAINSVKTRITALAQQYIDDMGADVGVSVPLGSFSGLVILMNTGPAIRLPVESVRTVKCSFESSFESAGINQTVHHITLTVSTEATVYSPFRISEQVRSTSTFEIAQTVIVGSVPSSFGNFRY